MTQNFQNKTHKKHCIKVMFSHRKKEKAEESFKSEIGYLNIKKICLMHSNV